MNRCSSGKYSDDGGGGAGRVRGVLGGEGDLARGDSDRDGGGSRSSVLMNIHYFKILNMKKYHQILNKYS